MPKKSDKQIKDEMDKCWEEYSNIDRGRTQLSDLLINDPYVFLKNITWVGNKKEMHPFFYINVNDTEKILVNFPYQEINLKAYRDGDIFFLNQSLRIIN